MALPTLGNVRSGGGLKQKGFAQYNAAATAAVFRLTTAPTVGIARPAGCSIAMVQPEVQGLRMRGDATDPTAAVGFLIPTNEGLLLDGDLDAWRFINAAAGTIVNVIYLG